MSSERTAGGSTAVRLPLQMHVFLRDWLSSNNVLLKGRDGAVMIDSGYGRHAPLTLALLASRRGLDGAPLIKLVNTHCHSDHIGGNAAIARAYGCPVALPAPDGTRKRCSWITPISTPIPSPSMKFSNQTQTTFGVISNGRRWLRPVMTWRRSFSTTLSIGFSFQATRYGVTAMGS